MITITFAIGKKLIFPALKLFIFLADTVAIFAMLNWELGIVEAIIVIMSVGLSVDFVVHFGVGYIHANIHDIEYERKKVKDRYLSSTEELNENLDGSSK